MSDNMISVLDFEYYFNKILATTNEVTIEISQQKNVESDRLLRSMNEIDDAILQAEMFYRSPLNLSVQTKDGLNNLVTVLDDTYALLSKVYSKKAN
jgi:hypothetical protein